MKRNWKIFAVALTALLAIGGLILALWPRSDRGDSEVKGDVAQPQSVLPNVAQVETIPTLSDEELGRFRKLAEEYERIRNTEGSDEILQPAEFRERLLKMTAKEREEELRKWKIAIETAAYNSPIDFWGRVVDQDGRIIQGAIIDVFVYDDPPWDPEGGSNLKYKKVSDSDGRFEIRNKKGASLAATASAEGYAAAFDEKTKRNLSRAIIDYAGEETNMDGRRPTKENPTVLVLHKELND